MSRKIKVTMLVSVEVVEAMQTLGMRRPGSTLTQVIEQAVINKRFIDGLQRRGNRILIEDEHGDRRQLVPR